MTDASSTTLPADGASMRRDNWRMVGKLVVVVAVMFAFGYALVPIYQTICTALGINVLSLSELDAQGGSRAKAGNTQVDYGRSITVEFDANAHGPWEFKPEKRSVVVHPGELTPVVYQFKN